MTRLERRCRWLLRAYPGWYRRKRGEEMLGTLLEASPPGASWPSFRDARALITGGVRVRGWVWLLSMLWVAVGAANTGYFFYLTTKPFTWADVNLGIQGWGADPQVVKIAIALATFAWLALLTSVPIAGFIRLRGWRSRNWLRAAAWAGGWIAGVALLSLAAVWGQYPQDCPNGPLAPQLQCPFGSPAVVSWGELPICAAWLVLGAVLTWILAGPAHRPDVPDTCRRHVNTDPGVAMSPEGQNSSAVDNTRSGASDEASRWPPGAGDCKRRGRARSVPDGGVSQRY